MDFWFHTKTGKCLTTSNVFFIHERLGETANYALGLHIANLEEK